jgi:tRNA threonylcarbamoyladenosine biosynthesis protein TsaB
MQLPMMNFLLYIDTSADTGTVAVSRDSEVLAHRHNEGSRNHAATINKLITDVLADAGISLEQLSAVVVCAGPGSYTGLRIGMATAKGLCYALNKPLILDNKLTLLAYRAYLENKDTGAQYISLITARDKEYFVAVSNSDFVCTLAPQHIMEEQLNNLLEKRDKTYLITDATEETINSLNSKNLKIETDLNPDLTSWAFYAFKQFECNDIVILSLAEPLYLKQVYTHK